ncbi:hypothetical protein JCM8097_004214 [Rhodosporidiobolus ruineniae]
MKWHEQLAVPLPSFLDTSHSTSALEPDQPSLPRFHAPKRPFECVQLTLRDGKPLLRQLYRRWLDYSSTRSSWLAPSTHPCSDAAQLQETGSTAEDVQDFVNEHVLQPAAWAAQGLAGLCASSGSPCPPLTSDGAGLSLFLSNNLAVSVLNVVEPARMIDQAMVDLHQLARQREREASGGFPPPESSTPSPERAQQQQQLETQHSTAQPPAQLQVDPFDSPPSSDDSGKTIKPRNRRPPPTAPLNRPLPLDSPAFPLLQHLTTILHRREAQVADHNEFLEEYAEAQQAAFSSSSSSSAAGASSSSFSPSEPADPQSSSTPTGTLDPDIQPLVVLSEKQRWRAGDNPPIPLLPLSSLRLGSSTPQPPQPRAPPRPYPSFFLTYSRVQSELEDAVVGAGEDPVEVVAVMEEVVRGPSGGVRQVEEEEEPAETEEEAEEDDGTRPMDVDHGEETTPQPLSGAAVQAMVQPMPPPQLVPEMPTTFASIRRAANVVVVLPNNGGSFTLQRIPGHHDHLVLPSSVQTLRLSSLLGRGSTSFVCSDPAGDLAIKLVFPACSAFFAPAPSSSPPPPAPATDEEAALQEARAEAGVYAWLDAKEVDEDQRSWVGFAGAFEGRTGQGKEVVVLVMERDRGRACKTWAECASTYDTHHRVFAAYLALSALGLVHRDLTPSNLLLTHRSTPHSVECTRVTIVDFGRAGSPADEDEAEREKRWVRWKLAEEGDRVVQGGREQGAF